MRKGSKKIIIYALCVIFFLSFGGGIILDLTAVASPAKLLNVVIDAGHGGIDGGATGKVYGSQESDLTLYLAVELKYYLEKAGIGVTMTRNSKAGLYGDSTAGFKKRDMLRRKEIIEKANADLVISIHMNIFPLKYRRGSQVCYQKGSEGGQKLANSLQGILNKYINTPQQNRTYDSIGGDYYMCKCCNCPSAIIECGFLSNEEDEALLITAEYRKQFAYYIYVGITEYLVTATNSLVY